MRDFVFVEYLLYLVCIRGVLSGIKIHFKYTYKYTQNTLNTHTNTFLIENDTVFDRK